MPRTARRRPLLRLGLALGLGLACANPFGAAEESPPPVDPAPAPPPAPIDPALPVKERVERVVTPAGDGERVSWVHVPARRLKSTPLVVVLHGGRDVDPRVFARRVDHWFDRGVALAFAGSRDRPERSKAKGKGKGKEAPGAGKGGKRDGEDDGDGDDPAWKEPEDAKFVEALVSDIAATRDIDPSRVYVVGLASGAELVWKLACTSRRFAGYAVVSGGLSRTQADVCPMPGLPARVAVFQATEDPWLLWTGDETWLAVNEALGRFGREMDCDLTGTTDTPRDDLDPDDGMTVTQRDWTCPDGALRLYEIAGATHGWPSRTQTRGWDTPRDIDTMDELAAFWGFPKPP